MEKVEVVFVVCTYGSKDDLLGFVASARKLQKTYAIVVANSYCSDETRDSIKEVAEQEGCVFLDLPNKGYGHSLNEGIEYANSKYTYKYLAITNADISVERFDIDEEMRCVYAPEVITKNGKRQNPFYVFSYTKLFLFSRWAGKKIWNKFEYLVIVVAKVHRILFNLFYRHGSYKKIYAAHGCFIVFSKEVIDELGRPFEDDVFLYCEENFLGYKLKQRNIPLYYTDKVSVKHMEDGSALFYSHRINDETKKSMSKYFDLLDKR